MSNVDVNIKTPAKGRNVIMIENLKSECLESAGSVLIGQSWHHSSVALLDQYAMHVFFFLPDPVWAHVICHVYTHSEYLSSSLIT